MKQFFFKLAAIGMMAGMLASCQKQEQSEANLGDLKGMANVAGKVTYNQGAVNQHGALISDYMAPATGQIVVVKVANADYIAGSQGFQTYQDTVDNEGRYNVQVPVGSGTVSATVSVLPFFAEKNVEGTDHQIVTIANALYNQVQSKTLSLSEFDVKTANFEVSSEDMPELAFNQNVSLKGTIEIESWILNRDTDDWESGTNPLATVFDVTVTLNDPNGMEPAMTLKYNTSSSSTGSYELSMVLPENCWDKDVRIEMATRARTANFVHHYFSTTQNSWFSQDVEVVENSMSKNAVLSVDNKLIPVDMGNIVVTTIPVDKTAVYGIGNPIDTEDPDNEIARNDPFGWGL